jgi:hypothetical protein
MFTIKENSSIYRNEGFGVEEADIRNAGWVQSYARTVLEHISLTPAPALFVADRPAQRSAFVGCKS